MTLSETRPTQTWLSATASFMPPLDGPAGTAERLLLLLHYSIDWDHSWVASYRTTYWDRLLPDRVLVASQQASNLRQWWTQLADDLHAFPFTPAARHELAQLLDYPDPTSVLRTLRQETLALVLRTRIVTESRKNR